MGEVFAEAYRLWLLRSLEDRLCGAGLGPVAGVDEAGRGCLAGPVVAAAVLVEPGQIVPGVDDSKKISAKKRARLAAAVRRAHPVHAVAAVSPAEIDRINILQATKRAMVRALEGLRQRPALAIVDAVALEAPVRTVSLVKGDQLSYAVACASILAKTERDRLMVDLHRRFPSYAFDSNKGYGSAEHRQALVDHGPCEVHRLTFGSVLPSKDGRPRPAARGC
ncbi:MAG: ribonuclease HII [Acidobacteriota bacterium]